MCPACAGVILRSSTRTEPLGHLPRVRGGYPTETNPDRGHPACAGVYRSTTRPRPDTRPAPAGVMTAPSAALFSSATFRALAPKRPDAAAARLLDLAEFTTPDGTVGAALDHAYRVLAAEHPTEYVFKNEIAVHAVATGATPLFELATGGSQADVALFGHTSTIFEVKSDYDSFTRLRTQLADYESRAEHVNVVVGDRRAATAEKHVPGYVGLWTLGVDGSLRELRRSVSGLSRVVPEHLYGLLRRDEAVRVLGRTLGYVVDAPNGILWKRMRDLFVTLTVEVAHAETVRELAARGSSARQLLAVPSFPRSLTANAFAVELNGVGRRRVLERLSLTVPELAVLLGGR